MTIFLKSLSLLNGLLYLVLSPNALLFLTIAYIDTLLSPITLEWYKIQAVFIVTSINNCLAAHYIMTPFELICANDREISLFKCL